NAGFTCGTTPLPPARGARALLALTDGHRARTPEHPNRLRAPGSSGGPVCRHLAARLAALAEPVAAALRPPSRAPSQTWTPLARAVDLPCTLEPSGPRAPAQARHHQPVLSRRLRAAHPRARSRRVTIVVGRHRHQSLDLFPDSGDL